MNGENRYWFEDVPEEQRFYFLVQYASGEPGTQQDSIFGPNPEIEEMVRREHEIGFLPQALNPPVWTDVQDRPDHQTPRIFTTRELAEERRRYHSNLNTEMQGYMELVEAHGEAAANQALDNSAPLRVVWTTREGLLDALAYAEFSHLMVDDRLVSSHAFRLELIKKLEESS